MIRIISSKISQDELKAICDAYFGTMVKFVVDIDRNVVALGGDMHADAEAVLLEQGSKQSDVWGGNLYPWNESENRIEYTSFINIRPMNENMGMEVQSQEYRKKIQYLIETLVLPPDEKLEPLN